MQTGKSVILCVVVSAAVAFLVSKYTANSSVPPPEANHTETSYERVVRTGILRCGYEYWDGAVMKDDKGQIYGPWVDIMNAIGEATGLKIEWTSEVGWGDVAAALKTNKVDAICAGMWTSAMKAKEISFTNPAAYQGLEAFVRADDHRFDDDINKLNNSNVKIVVIENDNTDFLAQKDFSKAPRVSLSTLNGTDSEEMMNVMTGKADVAFTVMGLWRQFDKANTGKVRPLAPNHKLRMYGLANAINNDDQRLLMILNAGEAEIQSSGILDKILDKANQDYPDMYLKAAKPYQ